MSQKWADALRIAEGNPSQWARAKAIALERAKPDIAEMLDFVASEEGKLAMRLLGAVDRFIRIIECHDEDVPYSYDFTADGFVHAIPADGSPRAIRPCTPDEFAWRLHIGERSTVYWIRSQLNVIADEVLASSFQPA